MGPHELRPRSGQWRLVNVKPVHLKMDMRADQGGRVQKFFLDPLAHRDSIGYLPAQLKKREFLQPLRKGQLLTSCEMRRGKPSGSSGCWQAGRARGSSFHLSCRLL